MRTDFFNKIEDIQEQFTKVHTDIYNIKNQPKPELDEETIIGKVLQKLPSQKQASVNPVTFDEEALISKIIARVPSGSKVYEVAPLVKIKKDFLEEAKNKILKDIETLNNNSKKTLKYLESKGTGCLVSEICTKGFMYPNATGGYSKVVNDAMKDLSTILVGEKVRNGTCFGKLKKRIEFLLEVHEATAQECQQVYDHVIMEMLG